MLEGLAIKAIKLYQEHLSRYTNHCPHEISCSNFTIEAISKEGLMTGGSRGAARILSCYRKDADAYVGRGKNPLETLILGIRAYTERGKLRLSREAGYCSPGECSCDLTFL